MRNFLYMNLNLKMTVERSKRRSYFLSLVFITKCFSKKLLLRTLNNASVKTTKGLVPKARICGVTSSTKYEPILVFRFVVVVLFRSPFVCVLDIGPPGIM